MLSCTGEGGGGGGDIGGCVPEKYLKMGRGDGHNKMTLREYWDYTIKWGWVDNKMGRGGYDFSISAFTGNS